MLKRLAKVACRSQTSITPSPHHFAWVARDAHGRKEQAARSLIDELLAATDPDAPSTPAPTRPSGAARPAAPHSAHSPTSASATRTPPSGTRSPPPARSASAPSRTPPSASRAQQQQRLWAAATTAAASKPTFSETYTAARRSFDDMFYADAPPTPAELELLERQFAAFATPAANDYAAIIAAALRADRPEMAADYLGRLVNARLRVPHVILGGTLDYVSRGAMSPAKQRLLDILRRSDYEALEFQLTTAHFVAMPARQMFEYVRHMVSIGFPLTTRLVLLVLQKAGREGDAKELSHLATAFLNEGYRPEDSSFVNLWVQGLAESKDRTLPVFDEARTAAVFVQKTYNVEYNAKTVVNLISTAGRQTNRLNYIKPLLASLDAMPGAELILGYNSALSAYCRNHAYAVAASLFGLMRKRGPAPDVMSAQKIVYPVWKARTAPQANMQAFLEAMIPDAVRLHDSFADQDRGRPLEPSELDDLAAYLASAVEMTSLATTMLGRHERLELFA